MPYNSILSYIFVVRSKLYTNTLVTTKISRRKNNSTIVYDISLIVVKENRNDQNSQYYIRVGQSITAKCNKNTKHKTV